MWGLLAGPLLREDGVLVSRGSSESVEMLLWNAVGLAAIVAWNGSLSFAIFYSLNKVHYVVSLLNQYELTFC